MFIFCFFTVTVPSLSQGISEAVHVHQQEIIPFLQFFFSFIFSSFKEWLCVLVITSAVHVCQFSKARAPVVEVIVVLVAPAAGGVEGA